MNEISDHFSFLPMRILGKCCSVALPSKISISKRYRFVRSNPPGMHHSSSWYFCIRGYRGLSAHMQRVRPSSSGSGKGSALAFLAFFAGVAALGATSLSFSTARRLTTGDVEAAVDLVFKEATDVATGMTVEANVCRWGASQNMYMSEKTVIK